VTTKAGRGPSAVLGQIGELDAIVSQHGADAVRHRRNQRFEEDGGSSHIGTLDQLHEGELRRAIDGHER
jgi:hypothetical protein